MDKNLLARANKINGEISQINSMLTNINYVIDNIDRYRASVDFKTEGVGVSFSLGAKKYGFKEDMLRLLEKVRGEQEEERNKLELELEKL